MGSVPYRQWGQSRIIYIFYIRSENSPSPPPSTANRHNRRTPCAAHSSSYSARRTVLVLEPQLPTHDPIGSSPPFPTQGPEGRKTVAHGVSRGTPRSTEQAPAGRQNSSCPLSNPSASAAPSGALSHSCTPSHGSRRELSSAGAPHLPERCVLFIARAYRQPRDVRSQMSAPHFQERRYRRC